MWQTLKASFGCLVVRYELSRSHLTLCDSAKKLLLNLILMWKLLFLEFLCSDDILKNAKKNKG